MLRNERCGPPPRPQQHGSPCGDGPAGLALRTSNGETASGARTSFRPLMRAIDVTIRRSSRTEKMTVETSVGRRCSKSAPAKSRARTGVQHRGCGLGRSGNASRVQSTADRGGTATRQEQQGNSVKFWVVDWPNPSPGENTITAEPRYAGQCPPAMTRQASPEKNLLESHGQVSGESASRSAIQRARYAIH